MPQHYAYWLLSGKCAWAIFLDDRAVLGVKFGPVTELFVHDRICIFHVFRAENVTKLVNQSDDIELGLAVRALIMKDFRDRHDHVPGHTLATVADTIHARPASC